MLDFFKSPEKPSYPFKEIRLDRKVFIYTDRFEVIHVRCRLRLFCVFVFPKGQYQSKYGSESDSMKKVEKQNNLN